MPYRPDGQPHRPDGQRQGLPHRPYVLPHRTDGQRQGYRRQQVAPHEQRQQLYQQPQQQQPQPARLWWECPSCNFMNWDVNRVCGGAKEHLGCKVERPRDAKLQANKPQQRLPQQAPPLRWACPRCHFSNWETNEVCGGTKEHLGCKAARPRDVQLVADNPQQQLRQQAPQLRWECPSCHFRNWETNEVCGGTKEYLGCKAARPRDVQLVADSPRQQLPQQAPRFRWVCPSCHFRNWEINEVCGGTKEHIGCKAERPRDPQLVADRPRQQQDTRLCWECPKCHFSNWESNQVCGGAKEGLGCKAERPTGGAGEGQRVCMLHAQGRCTFAAPGADCCPRGRHLSRTAAPPYPSEELVLAPVSSTKRRLLEERWRENRGPGGLRGVWQVYNKRLELDFQMTAHKLEQRMGKTSDCIDAWHGTLEDNVFSLACRGFDTARRSGQAYGAGEYFAKDPNVSACYCRGGHFMFLCKLLLGQQDVDHTWVESKQYYVVKQPEGSVQALPLFVVQFGSPSDSPLARRLGALAPHEALQGVSEALAARQRGAARACPGRRDAGMEAESTRHLWLGWLDPQLVRRNDDALAADVREFLGEHRAVQVHAERNGARIAAHVLLERPISRAQHQELVRRPYHGTARISIDDVQPGNPMKACRDCPRWTLGLYCRGWNVRGHSQWNWRCVSRHDPAKRPTANASYGLEEVEVKSAKYDDISTQFMRSAPFHTGAPRILSIKRVVNATLQRLYRQRHEYLSAKHPTVMEKDLWHGTAVAALPEVLKHGLQPPSDTRPSDRCPRSGGKGLCTTLCDTTCPHCTEPHCWECCHMYGLGVYLADMARKSHRYVRAEPGKPHCMLFCRTLLGNPYLIEGNLLCKDVMHDKCCCHDPSDSLDRVTEEWDIARGHDSYYVRGQGGVRKRGLGVENSEYIVFHAAQVLPLYVVVYEVQ